MKRFGVLMAVAIAATMVVGVASSSAFTGGGRAPSEAPLLSYGVKYTGELNNHRDDANDTYTEVAIYKLPPLSTRDQLTVNWQVAPYTDHTGFPIEMILLQGVNDFNWGEVFGKSEYDGFEVSESGTAQTPITVQSADSTSSYLMFFADADVSSSYPANYETFPYSFSVEPPRHYLGISLEPVQKVFVNSTLNAAATLVTGSPAPDGTAFTLSGTWSGGAYTGTGTSVGGRITFPLALPETAVGHTVEFVVKSAASAEYQAATSPGLDVEVTKPSAPPAPAPPPKPAKPVNHCPSATNKAHALARKYKRQLKNAEGFHGRHRRRAVHHAKATEREFLVARAAKQAAC